LPERLGMDIGLTAAVGQFAIAYSVEYRDYRKPDVTSTIRVPGQDPPDPRQE
jgi:hypothetical protein